MNSGVASASRLITTDARPICHSTARTSRIGAERQKPRPAGAAAISRTMRSPKPAATLMVQEVAAPPTGSTNDSSSCERDRTSQAWPGCRPRIRNGGRQPSEVARAHARGVEAEAQRAASLLQAGEVDAGLGQRDRGAQLGFGDRPLELAAKPHEAQQHPIRCRRLGQAGMRTDDRSGGHPALRPRRSPTDKRELSLFSLVKPQLQ